MLKLVPDSNKPPLAEFLNTLPSPLTVVLVNLGPSIARLRRFLEILSWKTPWEDSCLALALWWAGCLLSGLTLRYVPQSEYFEQLTTNYKYPDISFRC